MGSRIRGTRCTRAAEAVSVTAALLFVSAVVPAASLRSPPAPQRAAWTPVELVVSLRDLPKRYSCDELWDKFRDVLLAIGARPESIFAYGCESSLGSRARSPQVHMRFSLPEVVPEPRQKFADLSVVRKMVQLRPGYPPALGASDCNLLRQIKAVLLAALPVQVVSYRLACEAPVRGVSAFEVSVSAWTLAGPSKLAAAAPPVPTSGATVSGSR